MITDPHDHTDEWLAAVTAWAAAHTREPDLRLTEVVTEAWSTVWRSTRPDGYWFKQSTSANPAEGSVHHALSRLAPDLVRAPVAWDDTKGWLLTSDGGPTVSETDTSDLDVLAQTTTEVLRDYARLQLSTISHRDELLASGLPDHSPAHAPALLHACVEEMAAVPANDPRRLTSDEAAQLIAAVPAIESASATLEHGPVPLAFDHNDLFPRNVFSPVQGGSYRFFDFAESIWGHPFGSLVMLLWDLVHRHSLEVGSTGPLKLSGTPVSTIFDTYLQHWLDYAELAELRTLASNALLIAPLYRTAVWLTVLNNNPRAVARHGSTPRAWIFDVLRPVQLQT